jgi:hypothetical protein
LNFSLRITLILCVAILPLRQTFAVPMGGAEITAIRNKVDKVNAKETRPVGVKDLVAVGEQLKTKQNSLAELKFSDRSVVRLGANAVFSYDSEERLVQIDRGTVLIHTPPGNGGLTIVSGGVKGTVTGDTFLLTAYSEQGKATGGFALLVLEGRSTTRVTGPNGVAVQIIPGEMAVVGSASKGAPKVFNVNLAQTIRTCPLIGAFPDPLPTLKEITQAAIQQQARGEIKGTGATGLAIASDSDILVGESKPPNPGKRVFEMAVNKPIPGGNKDDSAKDAGLEDIETAAGGDGGGGGGVPSGGGTRGTGALGSSVPSTPNPPVTPPPPPNSNPATTPTPTTLPAIVLNASVSSKVYDGLFTAAVGNAVLSGIQVGDTVSLQNITTGTFASKNVGNWRVSTSMGLVGTDASKYSLTQPTLSAAITAKDVTIGSVSAASKVYNGNRAAVVTAGSLSGLVGSEGLGVTAAGTFADKNVGTRNVAVTYTLANGSNGGLASNYNLLNPTETLSATITAKDVTIGRGNVSGRVYNGTTGAVVTAGSVSGLVSGETLGVTTAMATFVDRNVGTRNVTATYSLTDGANPLHLASNYNLLNPTETLSATITAKALTVSGAIVTAKAYDGTTLATIAGAALETAITAGTGTDTDGKPFSVDAVTLGATTATFERNLPGTLIPVSAVMSLVGAGSGNYTLTQPTGLKGEITGSATLNRDGASVSVNSAEYVHIRNTTATRVQGGLSIQSTGGSVLLENSSFSAWMQKSSGGITLDALGMGVIQFNETAGVVVDKPILGIKMSSVPGGDMFLGDYRLTLSHYPTGTLGSPNDKTVDVLNHTAAALDPIGYGSAANGANLILRDGAVSSINSIDYASFDTASGDYKPNSPVSGLISSLATGLWNFLFSNESLNPNGQVDEVKLKYQEGKAVIRGAQGVEIVNVRFEGMDEVELEAASLGGRVLMSGTLVSDPTIGKIAMKALSSVQKDVLTGAGLPNSMDAVEAEINNPNFTGKSDITIAGDRALQIAAINVAGQLALNSHTIVFNNANVTSAGVIDARTRDGMVNRIYGSVVPGTVNFMGVNGNNFLNTANNASMSIANSANIVSALNGGQMRENGAGGATVMNVGRR